MLHTLSATELLRQLDAGETTSVAIVEALIARADATEPRVNALTHRFDDAALKEAKRCDEERASGELRGPLHGLPITIKESVDIHYQPIAKPRAALVKLLGDKNQNCPTLVLHKESPVFDDCGIMQKSGHRFINNARDIGRYYAIRYGTPFPRGSQGGSGPLEAENSNLRRRRKR